MKCKTMLAALASVWLATDSHALDLAPGLSLKGFGTFGAVSSNNSEANYTNNAVFQPNGAGRSSDVSVLPDSRLGLQLDWKASNKLDFVGQLLSKQRSNDSFAPVLEWAYGKYAVTPDLDIRLGRLRPPLYMLSDYIDVNYANPWVRPPQEFYATAALDRMDGIDALWRPSIGDYTLLLQPYFGTYRRANLQGGTGTISAHDLTGINGTVANGNLTLRAGYSQSHFSVFTPGADQQVFPALAQICLLTHGFDGAACGAYSQFQAQDRLVSFTSAGFTWDNGDGFVSGEVGKRTLHSYVSDATSWYLTGGRRFDKWTPYVTYSSLTNDSPTRFTAGVFPGIPSFGIPSTNGLLTALLVSNVMDQHTLTLGVRYDLTANLALKTQWDHVMTASQDGQPGTGIGLFGNPTAAFGNRSNTVDLLSASIDFVF